jgi:hypothetical protein
VGQAWGALMPLLQYMLPAYTSTCGGASKCEDGDDPFYLLSRCCSKAVRGIAASPPTPLLCVAPAPLLPPATVVGGRAAQRLHELPAAADADAAALSRGSPACRLPAARGRK